MKRAFLAGLGIGLWSLFVPTVCRAQIPGYRSPAVSPYINLTNPFQLPGITYYGIVRPEQEFRNNIGALQQRQQALSQDITSQEQAAVLPPTGHRVSFQNQAVYFQNLGVQRPAPRLPQGGASGRRPSAGGR